MEPLVSVIIPVYNVEEYLEECLNSVVEQTYHNLEIILVDDGSPDRCGEICDKYAEKDERIIVIHKKNGGLSEARNVALDIVKGEFVFFVDSDDIIELNTLEKLVSLCLREQADIALTGLKNFKENIEMTEDQDSYTVESRDNILKRILLHKGIGHEACGKLFRINLWDKYRFPVGSLYEDYAVVYFVIANAKKVVVYNTPKYYYRLRAGSIMKTEIKEKNLVLLDISDNVTDFFVKNYPDLKAAAIHLNIITYMKMMKNILDSGFGYMPDVQKRIINKVKKHKNEFFHYEETRFIDKIKVYSLLCGKQLFYGLYLIGDWKNNRNY